MSNPKVDVVATIYDKKGNLLARGYNSYTKTHPLQKRLASLAEQPDKIYLHAEIAAIIRCKGKKPYRIVVERYDKQGRPVCSKPCKVCEIAIRLAGIKEITYTP
jgi:deoxycytidylate deaminase